MNIEQNPRVQIFYFTCLLCAEHVILLVHVYFFFIVCEVYGFLRLLKIESSY